MRDAVKLPLVVPELHALLVGVSAYPHLPGGDGAPAPNDYGMRQLSACASSASVMEWLQTAADRLTVPLGTCRLLLSPSLAELDDRSQLAEQAVAPTRENFRSAALDWREKCASDRDNIAYFDFAGHGVQRTRSDAVLLMRDFAEGGGNPLYNAVDVNNLFGGMAPTVGRPEMARTQLWFIDACRGFPSAFDNFQALTASEIFGVELSDRDDRCAPIFFGALPGSNAYSLSDKGTLFSKALFESLRDAGGERRPGQQRWFVTIGSLLRGMQAMIADINLGEGSDQEVWDGGQTPRPDTPHRRARSRAGGPRTARAIAARCVALLWLVALDKLHDWTANSANWFEWLPDGRVAWAEHLARLGHHERAVDLLRHLPERGLPALSIGLTFAADRVRSYSAHWPHDEELRSTLEDLTRYALATNLAAPVTTFTGSGPDAPESPGRARSAALT